VGGAGILEGGTTRAGPVIFATGNILRASLALALASLLVGCGASPPAPAPASTLSPTTLAVTSPEVQQLYGRWGEPVTIEGGERITVEAPQVDGAAPPVEVPGFSGGVVVCCEVTIENIGNQPLTYDESLFELHSGNETWPGGGSGLRPSTAPALGSGELAPGETIRAAIAFQFTEEAATVAGTLRFYNLPLPTAVIEWH
jgi:hypothetical protein